MPDGGGSLGTTICVSVQDGLDMTDRANPEGRRRFVIRDGPEAQRLRDTEQHSAELAQRLSLSE
jgi:hypothetical protein